MGIAAGELNRQIVIEQPTGDVDELNQPTGTFVSLATVWAHILGQTGMGVIRNSDQGGIQRSISQYSFRIRYRTDLTSAMRVVYAGTYFNILQVRHDLDRQDWTDLVCETGGNNG